MGVDDYVTKPFDLEEMILRVDAVLLPKPVDHLSA